MTDFFFAISALVFLTGCSVGSFLNVFIDRAARGESIRGRSRCESCKKTLAFFELFPIASFFAQKGRCRSCGTALSLQYPAVEAGTGIAYAAAVWFFLPHFDYTFQSLFFLFGVFIGTTACIVIFVSDIKYKIIPNGAVLVLLGMGIFSSFLRISPSSKFQVPSSLISDFFAAFTIALFFASLWFVSGGRWMGLGDAKLVFATSLLVGYPASFSAFLFTFWLGGIAGAILILGVKKSRKHLIPFGPFILAGSILAYFFSHAFLRSTGLFFILP